MVPLKLYNSLRCANLSIIENSRLSEIIQRTRDGGAEIVKLLKTGSAFYAPGVSAVEMAYSIIFDERKLLPYCVFSSGNIKLMNNLLGYPLYFQVRVLRKSWILS